MATTTDKQALTTESLEAVWTEILDGIKARDRTLFVLLTSSGGVRLSVKSDKVLMHVKNEWQVKRIMQTGPKRVLETLINQYFNASVTIDATCDELDTLSIALDFFNLRREQWALPNEDHLKEEIAHHKEIVKTKNRHYKVLEKQSAKFDIHVPTHIILNMDDLKEEIRVADERITDIKQSMISARFTYINIGMSSEALVASRLETIRSQAAESRQEREVCLILKVKLDKHLAAVEELHELIKKTQEYRDLRKKSVKLTLVSGEVQRLAEEAHFLADEILALINSNSKVVFHDTVGAKLDELKSIVTMKNVEQNDMEQLYLGIKSVLSLLKSEIEEIEQL
jgi:hypothetical protein